MTRETKIGLLLGMGVILLIGIIISDQLSQVQQDPADFTGFAADTQRSIDVSNTTPEYIPIPTPGQTRNNTPAGPSHSTDVPGEFFIPDDVKPIPSPRQADAGNSLLTASNVNDAPVTPPDRIDDGVPTLTLGDPQPAVPQFAQAPTPQPDVITTIQADQPRIAPAGNGAVIRHTVQQSETLFKIAQRYYGNGEYWRAIMLANPGKVTPEGGVYSGAVLDIPKRDDALLGIDIASVTQERQLPVDTQPTTIGGRTIEVMPGDTLSELASKHLGTATRWQELMDANKDQLDSPQGLRVGMKLKLPGGAAPTQVATSTGNTTARPASSGKTYTVRPGDNLTEIAERTLNDGDKWKLIFEANRDKLKSPDRLVVGQQLTIPG